MAFRAAGDMIGVSLPIFELSKHSMRCGRTRRVPNDVKMIIRNSLLDQKNKEGRSILWMGVGDWRRQLVCELGYVYVVGRTPKLNVYVRDHAKNRTRSARSSQTIVSTRKRILRGPIERVEEFGNEMSSRRPSLKALMWPACTAPTQ